MWEERHELKKFSFGVDESVDGHPIREVHNGFKGAILRRDMNMSIALASALDRGGHSKLVWRELFLSLPELVVEVEAPCHFLRLEYEKWREEVVGSGLPLEQSFKVLAARVILMNSVIFCALTPRDLIRMVLIKNNAYYADFTLDRPCVVELCEKHMDTVPEWVIGGLAAGGSKYGLAALYAMAVMKKVPEAIGQNFVNTVTFLSEIVGCLCEWGYCERVVDVIDCALQRSPQNVMATSLRWAWTQMKAGERGYSRDRSLLVTMLEVCIKTPTDEETAWSPHGGRELYRLRHSGSSSDIRSSGGDVDAFETPAEMSVWIEKKMTVWRESLLTAEDTVEHYGLDARVESLPIYAGRQHVVVHDNFLRRYGGLTINLGDIHNFLLRYEMAVSADPRFRPGVRHRLKFIQTKIAAGKRLVPRITRENWRSGGREVEYDRFKETLHTISMRMTFFREVFERRPDAHLFIFPQKKENEEDPVFERGEWDATLNAESYYSAVPPEGNSYLTNRNTIPPIVTIPGIFRTDRQQRRFRTINIYKEIFDPSGTILPFYRWSMHKSHVNGPHFFITIDSVVNETPAIVHALTNDFIEVRKPQISALVIFRYLMQQPIFRPNVIYECREGFEEKIEYFLYTRDDYIIYREAECAINPDDVRPILYAMSNAQAIDEGLRDWWQKVRDKKFPGWIDSLPVKRLKELLPLSQKQRMKKLLTVGLK